MSAMDPLADQDKLRKVLSGQSMELCNFLQNVVAITYIFGILPHLLVQAPLVVH